MSKLRDQMLEELQLKGITPRTQKSYLREVRNFAKHFGKAPEQLGKNEVRKYLLYLLNERKLSEGTFRFYVAARNFSTKRH